MQEWVSALLYAKHLRAILPLEVPLPRTSLHRFSRVGTAASRELVLVIASVARSGNEAQVGRIAVKVIETVELLDEAPGSEGAQSNLSRSLPLRISSPSLELTLPPGAHGIYCEVSLLCHVCTTAVVRPDHPQWNQEFDMYVLDYSLFLFLFIFVFS
jgi:hypothetical protein